MMARKVATAVAQLLALGALSLQGCAAPPPLPPPMKAYSGPDQSDAQLAIVELSHSLSECAAVYSFSGRQKSCVESIKKDDHLYYDGSRDFTTEIKLQPGEYTITYGPINHGFLASSTDTARVDLRAGHHYLVKKESCGSLLWIETVINCGYIRTDSWIEDTTTGEVVAGTKPSWYSPPQ
jgi:hypothetical protein